MDNLQQTLRFLYSHDHDVVIDSELILVCQDSIDSIDTFFAKTYIFNLNLPVYHKSLMCNYGVIRASCDKIVLMDSDRVLPANYFRYCLETVKPMECYTAANMVKLVADCTDEEVEAGRYHSRPDKRSQHNKMHSKNMFSGNTTMYKDDYISRCRGMDENYVGYGFADNDMTSIAVSKGIRFVWVDATELHLFHPHVFETREFQRQTLANGLRYCQKWGISPGKELLMLANRFIGI